MHRNNKNPTPEPLNDAGAFQNGRRSNDEEIGGHRRQRLELAVRHILQNRNAAVLRFVAAGLQRSDCRDRRMGAGHGAPDRRREPRNLDPVGRHDLDLHALRVRELGARAAELVVGVVFVAAVTLLVAFVGFSLSLLPPFCSVLCQEKEKKQNRYKERKIEIEMRLTLEWKKERKCEKLRGILERGNFEVIVVDST